ncbi:MAG: hypothetical protein AB8G96_12780 [Phycisphaerales bacterium]
MNARAIQGIALAISMTSVAVGGSMLDRLIAANEEQGLRYTSVSVEGAPPWVAVGTAIGALRGLIVDVLWLKINFMKEQGLFYEVMSDAELITKLQPRFGSVWVFHGHNMAYNISVATHTQAERWDWVRAGMRLVQLDGLRHNPNDLMLYRELAFWYAHKLEGVADDAHLYYKREFAREWHYLLGRPPEDYAGRLEWIQKVADAPSTLDEAERRTPGVMELIERFDASMGTLGPAAEQLLFAPDRQFLTRYGEWQSVTERSEVAEVLGVANDLRANRPTFQAFDAVASDENLAEQWDTLVAFVRKKVLKDEYNLEAELMAELTAEMGPIDWRSGFAHALYFTWVGERRAGVGASDVNSTPTMLNNDRQLLQAVQGLAVTGRIQYDPLLDTPPTRFPEPRFIDSIERLFGVYYEKHYDSRGAGGETFIGFLQNFMGAAVLTAYRAGEINRAEQLLNQLNERFGTGGPPGLQNPRYALPLEVFAADEIKGELERQPNLAGRLAAASLQLGFRNGVGRDNEELWTNTVKVAGQTIKIFKENEFNDYETKFGEGRIADTIPDLPIMMREVFRGVMSNPGISIRERATIWRNIDRYQPTLRAYVYDFVIPDLRRQLAADPLGRRLSAAELFGPPPNLRAIRAELAAAEQARLRAEEEAKSRDEVAERGSGG